MDLGLDGKVALVTGASKGIGRGIAAELVAEGARVAISSHSRERVEATAAEIGATAYVHDSSDLDHAPRLVAEVTDALGPIEVLVCNTGGPPGGPDALGFTREQWQAAYASLVLGPMALVEAVLPGMRGRGFGRVLNVASAGVREPIPNLMLSNAHRISMVNAFKTIASQVAADGVTLNTVLPGRIDTDRLAELYGSREAAAANAAETVPAGRLGTVEEFAAVSALLCSARASYVTGETVAIDGGMLASVF
jgi:3-oxoacyl-[acyl-carrier protein] reductase